jgi:hypothetical protein
VNLKRKRPKNRLKAGWPAPSAPHQFKQVS